MCKCPKLEKIVELNDYNGNFEKYNDYLYEIFLRDLYNNKLYYNNKSIALRRYPEFNGKQDAFYHLTCKFFENNSDERLPDLRRCERLHWIKPGIETNHIAECGKKCFFIYEKNIRGKNKVHMLNVEDRYLIVLEERKDYYLLSTAFYIDNDKTLERKMKDYNRYVNS
ncbi:hypothetical protein HMPREF2811_05490 [Globicatella sp. HMSC072A10]|uniref:hypothetical protein n=1 Tax=Globicatella sp. HMSC072A10 TaxID=1739315 RepID=UPI0008C65D16|nr:hypothetical protein [Globicatella sp. HMSC072A10]OFK58543.1 hypothetical protein HMPREF2811_05490 [Globicatella sp. HMSC072A10]